METKTIEIDTPMIPNSEIIKELMKGNEVLLKTKHCKWKPQDEMPIICTGDTCEDMSKAEQQRWIIQQYVNEWLNNNSEPDSIICDCCIDIQKDAYTFINIGYHDLIGVVGMPTNCAKELCELLNKNCIKGF